MENRKIIDFLLEHNRRQSEAFCSPDVALSRRLYRRRHPTEVAWLKCMDGRLSGAVMTGTPPGIIQPFRNMGGEFDFGWPYFGGLMIDWVEYAIHNGRDCLLFVTYHFSRTDPHRGCRGFNYDLGAAKKYTAGLLTEAEKLFGNRHEVVYPIQVGIETDEDALILHSKDGKVLDLGMESDLDNESLRLRVERLYPDMKSHVVTDLLALLLGNIRHIQTLRANPRSHEDGDHREQILAVGRGFGWLHLLNKALIVGPYSFDVARSIAVAARILLENLEAGRIPRDEGVVLLAAAPYRDPAGYDRPRAVLKARAFARLSTETIQEKVPGLLGYLNCLVGVVDLNTQLFTPCDRSPEDER